MGKYRIEEISPNRFRLYENNTFLVGFTRGSVRASLEKLSRSSNWVGSILRIFFRSFPVPLPTVERSKYDRLLYKLNEEGIADYLRSKGMRVVRTIPGFSDEELIDLLEGLGFSIEGMLGDVYYKTGEKYVTVAKR